MRVSVCLGPILIPEYLDFHSGYSAPQEYIPEYIPIPEYPKRTYPLNSSVVTSRLPRDEKKLGGSEDENEEKTSCALAFLYYFASYIWSAYLFIYLFIYLFN